MLALVELAVYRLPQAEQFIVRPRTLARTETIRRYSTNWHPPARSPSGKIEPISRSKEASKNGAFWVDMVSLYVPKDLALDYLHDVAAAFGAELHQIPRISELDDLPAGQTTAHSA